MRPYGWIKTKSDAMKKIAVIFCYTRIKFQIFWEAAYPLHYAYKTEIEKICGHFLWLKKMQKTNSISLWYLSYILCIFTVDFFFNIRAKVGATTSYPPSLATRLEKRYKTSRMSIKEQ